MRVKIYLPDKLYIETFEPEMDCFNVYSGDLTIYSGLGNFLQKYVHPVPEIFLIKVKDKDFKYVSYLILSEDNFVRRIIHLNNVYINLGDLHD